MNKLPTGYTLLNQLKGKQLSSVEFVQDYFQIRFDGPTINVTSGRTTVYSNNTYVVSWDDQFRNMLCGQISKIVKEVSLIPQKELRILFRDKSKIIVSLHPDDQVCPEAIFCHGFINEAWTVA